MPPPSKPNRSSSNQPPRPEPAAAPKTGVPQGAAELGWLPDLVLTGGKFESGLAFFADPQGRITRFSREPADLATARRLPGQAALPGLVDGHAVSWHRLLRGRAEPRARNGTETGAAGRETGERLLARLSPDDRYETARMAFTEMLLAGITCVSEFHRTGSGPDGAQSAEPVLRAAHEVGIRLALFPVAESRTGSAQPASAAGATAEVFLRGLDRLRTDIAGRYPADEVWLGLAAESLRSVPLEDFKALAAYAHAQRLRIQVRLGGGDEAAARAQQGKSMIALLADHGLIDKRLIALHGAGLGDDDIRILGAARAAVCLCPTTELSLGIDSVAAEALLAAGINLALGTGSHGIDPLKEARLLEYSRRAALRRAPAIAPEVAPVLFQAATAGGARSLGATGGALEVGRPADFFTVNLFEPSLAGADAENLLHHVVFALDRRAIRDVWVGARQRIANGRHADQGMSVGRFVELERRLWPAADLQANGRTAIR